jgi:RNA polymerase sigma-70 factor (ECF subfamily)
MTLAFATALRPLLDRARAAWPNLAVPDASFAEQVARAVRSERDVASALVGLHAEDLYLALGCGLGDVRALAAFERTHAETLRGALTRMGVTAAATDEAVQRMRHEILLPRGDRPPAIMGFSGKGPLRAWLRVIAGRIARRVDGGPPGVSWSDAAAGVAGEDLELQYLKRTYGTSFEAAFRVALATLTPEDRVLLKQRLRHGLTVEQLGAMHGVHASTVSRWVTGARERLVQATREEMMRMLKVGRAEVSSILRLITSEVDITLSVGT